MSSLKLCAHHAPDGTVCQGAAMRGSNYCRHHRRYHPQAEFLPAYIFDVKDTESLWAATMRLVYDNIEGRVSMDPKTIYQCVHELHNFARRNLPKPPRNHRGARNPRHRSALPTKTSQSLSRKSNWKQQQHEAKSP